VITNQVDIPHAILIRFIQPLEGIEIMLERRKKKKVDKTVTNGPGSLSQALGINCSHDTTDLAGDLIWIEDRNVKVKPNQIFTTPRIGIDYAEEYVSKPWRFVLSM
jgi:DNA-3-methyladenine glycosylase